MRVTWLVTALAGCSVAMHATSSAPTPATTAAAATSPSPLAQLEASADLDGRVVGSAPGEPTVIVVMASWCGPCRDELAVFDSLREAHPDVRWLALNYTAYEEYADRGSAETIRALARSMPWLRVVPAGDALFDAFGAPSKIPTVIVYDGSGAVAARYNRHERKPPNRDELDALLSRL